MTEELNYTEASKELRDIVLRLEKNEVSIDKLSETIERAAVLIQFCKQKLRYNQETLNQFKSTSDDVS